MSEVSSPLTYDEVKEVKLPFLPWKRVATIRRYAAELVIPEAAPGTKLPITRIGLQDRARQHEYNNSLRQFQGRIAELEQDMDMHTAFVIATRELLGINEDPAQKTIFDKENNNGKDF